MDASPKQASRYAVFNGRRSRPPRTVRKTDTSMAVGVCTLNFYHFVTQLGEQLADTDNLSSRPHLLSDCRRTRPPGNRLPIKHSFECCPTSLRNRLGRIPDQRQPGQPVRYPNSIWERLNDELDGALHLSIAEVLERINRKIDTYWQ